MEVKTILFSLYRRRELLNNLFCFRWEVGDGGDGRFYLGSRAWDNKSSDHNGLFDIPFF